MDERCAKCFGRLPYRGGALAVGKPCECGHCACESCVLSRVDPENWAKEARGGLIGSQSHDHVDPPC